MPAVKLVTTITCGYRTNSAMAPLVEFAIFLGLVTIWIPFKIWLNYPFVNLENFFKRVQLLCGRKYTSVKKGGVSHEDFLVHLHCIVKGLSLTSNSLTCAWFFDLRILVISESFDMLHSEQTAFSKWDTPKGFMPLLFYKYHKSCNESKGINNFTIAYTI